MTVVVGGVTKGSAVITGPLLFQRCVVPSRGSGKWLRVLVDFNASTLDPVGPLGGDQGMKVLADQHEEFVKSLVPGVDGV
jgi:hypothetical protein